MPPAPATMDLHTHTLRSDGILTPLELVDGRGRGRRPAPRDHRPRHARRRPRAPRAPETPAGLEVLPGSRSTRVVRDRDHVARGRGPRPGASAWIPTTRRSRRPSPASATPAGRGSRRWSGKLRDLGHADRRRARDAARDDRRGRARPAPHRAGADRRGPRRRASRTRSTATCPGAGRPTCRARASGRARRSGRSARPAASRRWPTSRRRRAHRLPARADRPGPQRPRGPLPGLRPATVRLMRRIADDLRLVKTGGTDYHGDRETYAEAHAQLWFPRAGGRAPASARPRRCALNAPPAPTTREPPAIARGATRASSSAASSPGTR